MEEKQKNKKTIITKETIISAVIGLIIGIVITCLVVLCINYFKNRLATINGKTISAKTINNKVKLTSGFNLMMSEIDKTILNDIYTLTEEEEKEAKEQADYYIDSYTSKGYSEQEFLEMYGFSTYDEFLEDIKVNIKSNKYLYDYLEKKLEPGAVQKYYDENKDKIETYDSEHILVKISDTVTDDQALALANEIIAKLNEGKSFNEVVEEYKDKIVYEELGFQGKSSSLQQVYIDELIALKDGEYSKTPIKTTYGYHIVHRLATSTIDDLRETIIETLSTDSINKDQNIPDKAFVELRKENNLKILDKELNKKYEEYCEELYKEDTNS